MKSLLVLCALTASVISASAFAKEIKPSQTQQTGRATITYTSESDASKMDLDISSIKFKNTSAEEVSKIYDIEMRLGIGRVATGLVVPLAKEQLNSSNKEAIADQINEFLDKKILSAAKEGSELKSESLNIYMISCSSSTKKGFFEKKAKTIASCTVEFEREASYILNE